MAFCVTTNYGNGCAMENFHFVAGAGDKQVKCWDFYMNCENVQNVIAKMFSFWHSTNELAHTYTSNSNDNDDDKATATWYFVTAKCNLSFWHARKFYDHYYDFSVKIYSETVKCWTCQMHNRMNDDRKIVRTKPILQSRTRDNKKKKMCQT